MIFENKNQILRFTHNVPEDEGKYRCDAVNDLGLSRREISVIFKSEYRNGFVLK